METLDYAIQIEKEVEAYYRQLAHRTSNKGLCTILSMLADEEVKHQQVFEGMRSSVPRIEATQVLTRAKNIFAEMRGSGLPFPDDTGQIDLYRQAQDLEKKSQLFYETQARDAEDAKQSTVLRAIAMEEEKHFRLLEAMVEFVSRPEAWLEDAEFHHLDEY